MQTFKQIQFNIGHWSLENFGNQDTPYLAVSQAGTVRRNQPRGPEDAPGDLLPDSSVALDSLAPLLGMVEELGELADAATELDTEDACADIGIYLCDYLCRMDMVWPTNPVLDTNKDPLQGMVSAVGKLAHATLKRHQRIRGMHSPQDYRKAVADAVRELVYYLKVYTAKATNTTLLEAMNQTWNKIVSKRDWRKDPEGDKA